MAETSDLRSDRAKVAPTPVPVPVPVRRANKRRRNRVPRRSAVASLKLMMMRMKMRMEAQRRWSWMMAMRMAMTRMMAMEAMMERWLVPRRPHRHSHAVPLSLLPMRVLPQAHHLLLAAALAASGHLLYALLHLPCSCTCVYSSLATIRGRAHERRVMGDVPLAPTEDIHARTDLIASDDHLWQLAFSTLPVFAPRQKNFTLHIISQCKRHLCLTIPSNVTFQG